jgi:PAS domain S-box-containing protein
MVSMLPSSPPDPAGELALLHTILRETPAALAAAAGPEHRLSYCNARYQANTGGRAQMGRPIAACLPELVGQGFVALLDAVYRTGQPFYQEELLVELHDPVTHRPELFYYTSTLRPLRDAHGRVTGVLIFAVDATAQVRARQAAERALAEQRAFYETLLQELPAVVVALDPAHRYLWVNSLLRQQMGFDDRLLGQTNAEACAHRGYPPAIAAERDRRFAQAARGHCDVSWEETVPGPAGDRYWLRRMRPVYDAHGELRLMVATGLDLTEHRRAEARVQQQQAWTQRLLDALPNPIWVTDARGRVQFANAAQRALSHRLARQPAAFAPAPALAPELRQVAALKQRVLATGQEAAVELTLALDTGEPRDYHVTMCPLPQVGGAVHVLTVGTDVTALKQAQRAATAAVQAQERFLATMSHEIRTPLNGVLGMAGLLAKTPLTAEQRRHLDVVQHSGRHLLAVLNDVLDMAKIRSGQLHLEAVPVDLAYVLDTAAQTLTWQAQAKGLALEVVGFDAPLPWVHTDPMRLNQVLLNLLSNALKFTKRGRVTLHAAVRAETATHLRVHFQVRDTGPGVALAVQEHIFDAFAQAADDTTRRFGGTGLGLAISSQLVAQLGGHLVLCSEAGRGSTFAFTLALAKCAAPAAETCPGPRGETGSLRGWRVLVVDDNAWNQELARAVLEHHGAAVDATASASAALALFEQHRYDVVLMDVHMPGMNGLEATGRLRQHPDPERAATPVLALTADAFPAQHASYRAAGMSDVLAKPFTEAELLAKFVAVARKARLGDE